MGDKVGRVYLESQDLGQLQSRKFKGLKRSVEELKEKKDAKAQVGTEVGEVAGKVGGGEGRKRTKVQEE